MDGVACAGDGNWASVAVRKLYPFENGAISYKADFITSL